jgi:hypothetical protein
MSAAGMDVLKWETSMSFRQIKSSMQLHKNIRQVKHEIYRYRRETAHVRLEAIAGTDHHCSLLQVFGQGYVITNSGAVAHEAWCNPMEVGPRVSPNYTEEIPVNGQHQPLFGPISYIIKSAAWATRYDDIAPSRWNIAGQWYCVHPSIPSPSPPPGTCLWRGVQVNEDNLLDLAPGWSTYSKAPVEEFLKFQDSQGTLRANLAESAELAFGGCGEDGAWGVSPGDQSGSSPY